MNTKLRSLLALLPLTVAALCTPACSKPGEPAPATATRSDATHHPLKGVVVEVQTAQSALLVRHGDIPGFMSAMTMAFQVDAATLKAAAPGQVITATLVQRGEELWLEDVKPAASK